VSESLSSCRVKVEIGSRLFVFAAADPYQIMLGVRSVVASGARSIALDGTRFLKVPAAAAAAARHLLRPALSCSVPPWDSSVRCYSASPLVNRIDTAEGVRGDDGKPSTTQIFFVQRRGSADPAVIEARGNMFVGSLKEEIKKELPSLRDVDSDTIILQLANADGNLFTTKDADGKEQPVRLNRR
jgi:hypothetical protein